MILQTPLRPLMYITENAKLRYHYTNHMLYSTMPPVSLTYEITIL
jgi:hypothetical protein